MTLLDDVYAGQITRPRATASIAATFSVTALVTAACGMFGLLSDSVARRRREFGIRVALGAGPGEVRKLVWSEGAIVTLSGLGVGTTAGVLISRTMAALMYQVAVTDVAGWAIVAAVLMGTIAAAAWPPARSAVLSSPASLLREE